MQEQRGEGREGKDDMTTRERVGSSYVITWYCIPRENRGPDRGRRSSMAPLQNAQDKDNGSPIASQRKKAYVVNKTPHCIRLCTSPRLLPRRSSPILAQLILLEREANVNAQDRDHTHPCYTWQVLWVRPHRVLLDHGTKTNAGNVLGQTLCT
ncbi:hypothetical protein EDB92DRAFT_2106647 [Lactarius akahatsu]|uniref:Uncharacterized protein n=1 Tax=Lactarius akahatsu TaxID=416441 RepID=A0AAD4L6K1_9AGAM|nr:hypothetical protein EDB92DRAFT_2106647 [Lactarius akahatsu]